MKAKLLTSLLILFFSVSCQIEKDEIDMYNPVTDTFVLVDYYDGIYKFVQIENLYTIGVVEGLINIPQDFNGFQTEDKCLYYKVDLKLTGINQGNIRTEYQRYTGNSVHYQVSLAGNYSKTVYAVQRIGFYNDYLYYVQN